MDGWSNVNNDPIVATSLQFKDKVYMLDAIDTDLRNKLGTVKVAKLAFCLRALNE